MNDFAKSSKELSTSPEGSVIEFTFRGEHHWTHGPTMKEYIDSVLENHNVSGIVLNLLDYSYVFGNDLGVLFMAGYERSSRQIRPICVLAHGQTRASLVSLLKEGHCDSIFDVTFAGTTEEVVEWQKRRVRPEPS